MQGSYVALVTPFNEDGSVDFTAVDRLLEWHVSEGTEGVVLLGTTGESAAIHNEERSKFIVHCVSRIAGRIHVMVGTGSTSTDETIKRTLEAKSLGANSALIVTPYYNKPNQTGLYEHYSKVAESCRFPIVMYNVPSRTSCDLSVDTVIKLSSLEFIVGIKEANKDLSRVIAYTQETELFVFSGDDGSSYPFVLSGGHGVISVTANVLPKEVSNLVKLARLGERIPAMDIAYELQLINRFLSVETNPIPCKWLLAQSGIIKPYLRLPLTQLAENFEVEGQVVMSRYALCAIKMPV